MPSITVMVITSPSTPPSRQYQGTVPIALKLPVRQKHSAAQESTAAVLCTTQLASIVPMPSPRRCRPSIASCTDSPATMPS